MSIPHPNFRAQFAVHDSEPSGVLTFQGELNIQQAAELKSTLLDALNRVEKLVLDIEQVTEFDLASIQILFSAFKTSACLQKNLSFAGSTPVFKKALEDSGYSHVEWAGSH